MSRRVVFLTSFVSKQADANKLKNIILTSLWLLLHIWRKSSICADGLRNFNDYLSNQLTRSLKAISTYSVILINAVTSLFEIFLTKLEVTSSIENTSSDSCSTCPNNSKTTTNLPISDSFDFDAKIVHPVVNKTESYQLILLIFNTKHGVAYDYDVSKFEQNRTKFTVVIRPHKKIQYDRRWRKQIEIFKTEEKRHRNTS